MDPLAAAAPRDGRVLLFLPPAEAQDIITAGKCKFSRNPAQTENLSDFEASRPDQRRPERVPRRGSLRRVV